MLAVDDTERSPAALDRVRELANELARSHPNAKSVVRELFLAMTAVYDEARGPYALESRRAAFAALNLVREAIEAAAPASLPCRDTVEVFYGPEPVHEAQAIADTLRELLGRDDPAQIHVLPDWDEFKPHRT